MTDTAALRAAIEALPTHTRRNGCASPTTWVTRREVLRELDRWAAAQPDYEMWVRRFAVALHRDCVLEWDAIAVVDPGRALTLHDSDAHYGRAHDLVRRLFPELDTTA